MFKKNILGAVASMIAGSAFAADLGGREIVVVTENAYPPLQFMDPSTGNAIGWEYDAIAEIGKRLLQCVIATASGVESTCAERLGQEDFIPWKRGTSL